MDLTREFNAAAGGGPDPVDQTGAPQGPIGPEPGSAGVGFDAPQQPAAPDLGSSFNQPPQFVEWEDPDFDEEELPERRNAKVAEAESELEMLETGRATPRLENNMKPARGLEQAVHTEVEQHREFRIAALNAYLEFSREPQMQEVELAADNDLEFSL